MTKKKMRRRVGKWRNTHQEAHKTKTKKQEPCSLATWAEKARKQNTKTRQQRARRARQKETQMQRPPALE
jgi:hypothetical protein